MKLLQKDIVFFLETLEKFCFESVIISHREVYYFPTSIFHMLVFSQTGIGLFFFLNSAWLSFKSLKKKVSEIGFNVLIVFPTRNGFIYFPEFCAIVNKKLREEDEEVFRQNMFKVGDDGDDDDDDDDDNDNGVSDDGGDDDVVDDDGDNKMVMIATKSMVTIMVMIIMTKMLMLAMMMAVTMIMVKIIMMTLK